MVSGRSQPGTQRGCLLDRGPERQSAKGTKGPRGRGYVKPSLVWEAQPGLGSRPGLKLGPALEAAPA